MSTDGRVALVTGAGKTDGIGAASAMALAVAGFRVAVTDVQAEGVPSDFEKLWSMDGPRPSEGVNVVDQIRSHGGEAQFFAADLTSRSSIENLIAATVDRFGAVDVLVNNAAATHGYEHGEIERVSEKEWDRVVAVNAKAAFLLTQLVVPGMRESGWGRIVNVASIAGVIGLPRSAIYSASKAGLIGLTRSLAVDVANSGITVNAVCPGRIMTSRIRSSIARASGGDIEMGLRRMEASIPAGRLGNASEVAAAVAFFASPDCSYITGQVLAVDGGAAPC